MSGTVLGPDGAPVAGALVEEHLRPGTADARTLTDTAGHFALSCAKLGKYRIQVSAAGMTTASRDVLVTPSQTPYELQFHLSIEAMVQVTVTANVQDTTLTTPDPALKVFVGHDLLEANPGRPGAPVSLPGYPAETASGGIKAPQYFAPGVAGDHGEPIAQFLSIGGYLLPNNLSANAHGNGYADPNILIPATIESVAVDGGAFNVLEGNHSVNLAAVYGLRSRLEPSLSIIADDRDVDAVGALSPGATSWLALEASFGNGLLQRLEHRQQYKLNAQRTLDIGQHHLTLAGIGYYGSSFVPGLVPLLPTNVDDAILPNVGDTIDPRQKDRTHTALIALDDTWKLNEAQGIRFAGFFRTYNLALFSDFGAGLIRQSEWRAVLGAETSYTHKLSEQFSLLTGLDFEREAARRDNLDHFDLYTPGDRADGPFTKVDSADVTITPVTPFVAVQGALHGHLRYYAGWRRDQIDFDNQDLVSPENSFQRWVGINSPKATVAITPGPARYVPLISASWGESFFTEDPRIGTGTAQGTPVSRAHSYELVASKTLWRTDLKLTLGHTTTSEELAKIDPDTGLQEDQGPGRLRYLTATAQRTLLRGSLLLTFSKADARDVVSGLPTAEAPRTIIDALWASGRLPLGLEAKSEWEYVGKKPLGTGCNPDPLAECVGVPVREFRTTLARHFENGRYSTGLTLFIADGYTGQTTETFGNSAVQEIVGVRVPSWVSVNVTYHFLPRTR